MPSRLRIVVDLAPIPCPLDVDPELLADALDHEGRHVLVADLRDCACGSPDGYEIAGRQVTCAACVRAEDVRERSDARRRRAHTGRPRRRRRPRQAPAATA